MRYSPAMNRTAACLLLVVAVCADAITQQLTPPSKAELEVISTRGRMLYESDEAAWHSTDAVQAIHPDQSLLRGYFARKIDRGWEVAYGRLNESGDKFLVAYLATQSSAQDKFTVETFTPPKEDAGFFLSAARARVAALNELGSTSRPYNLCDNSG